jgi:hypothetical protein
MYERDIHCYPVNIFTYDEIQNTSKVTRLANCLKNISATWLGVWDKHGGAF